jgi:hypothetical protein
MLPLNRKRESQNHVTGQRLVASSGYAVFLTCRDTRLFSGGLARAEGVPVKLVFISEDPNQLETLHHSSP